MRTIFTLALIALMGCRGEPVPRDYTNNPPAMTHPVDNQKQSPSAHGMPGASPEPSKGAEGKTTQPVDPLRAPTPAPKDSAPVQTGTTGTVAVATHT